MDIDRMNRKNNRHDDENMELDIPYGKRRKEVKRRLGRAGTSALDARDKITSRQAVRQEMKDWGVEEGDYDGLMREYNRLEDEKLSPEEVFKKYDRLFDFLSIEDEGNPNVVEEFSKITDKKEKLEFILTASLMDKIRLFCSDNFGFKNYDSFMDRLQFQQDFISGKAEVWEKVWDRDKRDYVDVKKQLNPSLADSDNIMLGLQRASLRSAMLGTPEYGAYKMSLDIMKSRDWEMTPDFPVISGYDSGIGWSNIGSWGVIIDEYKEIADKVAKRNLDMDEEELEHVTVRKVAKIFADSMGYNLTSRGRNSSYVSHFHESVAWAQLGDGAQRQFRGMRHKIDNVDLSNIGRFIGKSGYSKKRASMDSERGRLEKRIEYANGLPEEERQEFLKRENAFEIKKQEEWREKEIYRIQHKYDKLIKKTRSEERRIVYVGRREEELSAVNDDVSGRIEYFGSRTFDGLMTDMNARVETLTKKIGKRKSLAEKAIDLHFMSKDSSIDWINAAPFGAIKRAHKRMESGMSAEENETLATKEILENEIGDPERIEVVLRQLKQGEGRGLLMDVVSRYEDLGSYYGFDEINKAFLAGEIGLDGLYSMYEGGLGRGNLRLPIDYPWLAKEFDPWVVNNAAMANTFPLGKSEAMKYAWCSNNAFSYLDGDWGRQTIGKIIYTRLQAGVDNSLHDASFWFDSFQIPEQAYDIAKIKKMVKNGENIPDLEQLVMRLFDKEDERRLLARIVSAPEEIRSKVKLSRKEQNVNKLFSAPENMLIYSELVKLYQAPDCNYENLRSLVEGKIESFYEENLNNGDGKSSLWRMDLKQFRNRVAESLDGIFELITNGNSNERIGEIMQRLNQYGNNRKAYVDDATSWLVKHTVSPASSITKAWRDRALALKHGAKDTASDIIEWQKMEGIRNFIKDNPNVMERLDLSSEDIFKTYDNFTKELSRVYGVETTLESIAKYKKIKNPDKIMPAKTFQVEIDGANFTGSVLAYDDPRGMTIGADTGCCMTVDGASRSCIESGYRDREAGFFALYDPSDKLMAQSFFYINPEYPDIVIMDNIEANAGRNSGHIIEAYIGFFRQYLEDRFKSDSNWQIRQVNVGTRYGEVAKAQVNRLEQTEIIINNRDIYTDAREDQRLIIRLTDRQIAQLRGGQQELELKEHEVVPNHEPISLTSPLGIEQLPILQDLEARVYPAQQMRQYEDEDFAFNELNMPEVGKYSFLIKSEADATSEAVGYCLAYEADSETDPNYNGKVVYIADFGIVPEARNVSAAMKGFNELLSRLNNEGVKKAELDARESTSYRFFTSEAGKRYLERKGFRVIEYDNITEFGDGERTVLLSLERI